MMMQSKVEESKQSRWTVDISLSGRQMTGQPWFCETVLRDVQGRNYLCWMDVEMAKHENTAILKSDF